jgi:uncharacterized protein YndB with AHSA1/START domain
MRNHHSIEIDAPADRVFHWLDDAERLLRWVPHLVESEDLTITDDRVGSTFRQVFLERGRRTEMRGVVTAYERDRRLACEMRGDAFELSVCYRLEDLGSRTRLSQESALRFHRWPMRVLGAMLQPLIRRSAQKQLEGVFANLKRLAESGP